MNFITSGLICFCMQFTGWLSFVFYLYSSGDGQFLFTRWRTIFIHPVTESQRVNKMASPDGKSPGEQNG